jgi:predicted nucleic acid-binding Zn ribbon protein
MEADFLSRTNTSTGRLTGIGIAVRSVIATNALTKSITACQAMTLWPEIAGEQLANVCKAESVRDGTLYVKAKSSSWANELTFHKPELLRKLGARLGAGVVNDIHFSTASRMRSSRTETAIAEISSEPALEKRKQLVLGPMDSAAMTDPKLKLRQLIERSTKIVEWRRENGWVECVRCAALYDPIDSTENSGGVCPFCMVMMR